MNGISELFVVNYGKELPKIIRVTFTGVYNSKNNHKYENVI